MHHITVWHSVEQLPGGHNVTGVDVDSNDGGPRNLAGDGHRVEQRAGGAGGAAPPVELDERRADEEIGVEAEADGGGL